MSSAGHGRPPAGEAPPPREAGGGAPEAPRQSPGRAVHPGGGSGTTPPARPADDAAEGDRDSGRRSQDSGEDRLRWLPSLRWTPFVRAKFLTAIESVDITKHWRHGSKAAFWYQVLETFWRQQGYEQKYKQPHINSLNMKFFEIYDAYMEGTGEAGPSGSGARTARSKLGPKDLTREENEICARIKKKFEPIRAGAGSHKQPRAKLGDVAEGQGPPHKRGKRSRHAASTSKQPSEADEQAGRQRGPSPDAAYYAPRGADPRLADPRGSRGRQRSPSDGYRQPPRRMAHGAGMQSEDPLDSHEYLFLLLESKIHGLVEKLSETIDVENERHSIEASIWMEHEEYSRRKIALLAEHLEEAAAQRQSLVALIQDNRALLEDIRMEQRGLMTRHM